MKWFKIDNDNFLAKNISVQYTINTIQKKIKGLLSNNQSFIDITLVIESNSINKTYFFDIYNKKDKKNKFSINSSDFTASGCQIKSISIDPIRSELIVEVISEFSSVVPIEQRRDNTIDEILNETSNDKNNIK